MATDGLLFVAESYGAGGAKNVRLRFNFAVAIATPSTPVALGFVLGFLFGSLALLLFISFSGALLAVEFSASLESSRSSLSLFDSMGTILGACDDAIDRLFSAGVILLGSD